MSTTTNVFPPITESSENAIATLASLTHRSVERLAHLHKETLDTFANYAADLNQTMRLNVKPEPPAIVHNVLDLTQKSVQGWVDAQKTVIDLIAGQSAHVAEAVRNRAIFSKPTDVLAELFEGSAERAVKAQKTMLDYAASQNRAVSDVIRNHAGTAAAPVVRATDSFEKGFDQAIEAQKELLETGVKLLKRA